MSNSHKIGWTHREREQYAQCAPKEYSQKLPSWQNNPQNVFCHLHARLSLLVCPGSAWRERNASFPKFTGALRKSVWKIKSPVYGSYGPFISGIEKNLRKLFCVLHCCESAETVLWRRRGDHADSSHSYRRKKKDIALNYVILFSHELSHSVWSSCGP